MKARPDDSKPATVTVATSPKQAGETHDRWGWVEQAVWTTRMLIRLAQSGLQTKWFALWDKVWAQDNLLHAFYAVWRNDGIFADRWFAGAALQQSRCDQNPFDVHPSPFEAGEPKRRDEASRATHGNGATVPY